MDHSSPNAATSDPGSQLEELRARCRFSIRLVEVEALTAVPIPGLDETWSSLEGRPIKRVPLLRLYGTTPAGQKSAVTVHNAYPYFFVNIPESVLAEHYTFERLSAYALQLAHALNRATQLNLAQKSNDAQYVHNVTVVQGKPFYGYTPETELFFKVFIYNPMLVTRMTTLLRNKTVLGTSFRIFESHVPYPLQFFIEHRIYGMGFVNFGEVKYRLPLPKTPRRRHMSVTKDFEEERVPSADAHGAYFFGYHLDSTVPVHAYLNAAKDTRSEVEVDVDEAGVLEPPLGALAFPNHSGLSLSQQMVPSLAYMWEEERTRRYKAAKEKNGGISPALSQASFGPGSTFDSAYERFVEGPHNFHVHILEKFQQLVEKDERDVKNLWKTENPARPRYPVPSQGQYPSNLPPSSQAISSQLAKYPHLQDTPMATTKFRELTNHANYKLQQHLQVAASQNVDNNVQGLVDEELASSQQSDASLIEALKWLAQDDWNNPDWSVGEASVTGAKANGGENGRTTTEDDEQRDIDADLEAILASQRDVHQNDDAEDDALPPSPERRKRDHDEMQGEGMRDPEAAQDAEAQFKPRKKVKFVEIAQVLHFTPDSLYADMIERRELTGRESPPPQPPTPPYSGPPTPELPAPDTDYQPKFSGLDSQEIIQATQRFPSSIPALNEPLNGSSTSDSMTITPQAPTSSQVNRLLSTRALSTASLIRLLGSPRSPPLRQPTQPKDTQATVVLEPPPQASPPQSPLQSSVMDSNASREFIDISPPAVPSVHSSDEPSVPSVLLAYQLSGGARDSTQQQEPRPGEPKPLILKFGRAPPTWTHIMEGMKAKELPLLRYQAPYYGVNSDLPQRVSRFAGIALPIEIHRYDLLPPFVPPLTPSTISDHHALGSARQQIRRKSIRGGTLRALTPARAPPSTKSLLLPPKPSPEELPAEPEPANEEDDYYELVPNSPKLAEQFKLVATVRKGASKTKKAHEVLEEDNERRRKPVTFSQSDLQNMKKRKTGETLASQLDRVAPSNAFGFALRPEAKRSVGGQGQEGLTLLSLEVFAASNGELRPDPHVCPVEAIYFCIRDDFVIQAIGAENYRDELGVLCLKRNSGAENPCPNPTSLPHFTRKEFETELELLLAFRDMLVEVDPDVVMGYECQQSSLGYIFERAIRLGIPKYIPSFGRASGDLGNNMDTAADSWSYQHASGISMVGRIVFNVWRIMRSELALQSYSFESIAFHVLHQRIPHFDHLKLTSWYSGLSDLGASISVKAPPKTQNPYGIIHTDSTTTESMDIKKAELSDSQYMPSQQYSSPPDDLSNIQEEDKMDVEENAKTETKKPETKQVVTETEFSKKKWPPAPERWRVDLYFLERAQCNFYLLDALNVVPRTSEFARMYGITFYSVLSRGSQFRVESLMLRMTKPQNYICVSPTRQQVAQQLAPESIPLVMEPLSAFYTDPVLVLDFQSLYPSVIIAYNLCFSTCLGRIGTPSETPGQSKRLGVLNYDIPAGLLSSLKDYIYCAPNGVMYVKPEHRTGTLPRMLHEILETRMMIKESMKSVKKKDPLLWSMLDSRQLGLKMIANVTYGYASASFSGRMPCIDVADSIVQTGRETLERAIKMINSNEQWGAKVIYGDTDSLFVLLKGASKQRAFALGNEISKAVTDDNPWPIKLKFEKVYHPCVLLAKKRYVGYMYESVDQEEAIFDAKGIETVRRDTCPAVSKILEKCLRMLFESKDMSLMKSYLRAQWSKILTGRVSLLDFVFRKEVRLGTYRGPHAPPAALVAMKELARDPRSAPRYGERVPYIVVNGSPKSRLIDLVFHPTALLQKTGSHSSLSLGSALSINATYYITKNIIPVLSRVFDLFGVSIADWYLEMPKKLRNKKNAHVRLTAADLKLRRQTIDHYFSSQYCPICDALTAKPVCEQCMGNKALATFILASRIKLKQQRCARLLEICMQCTSNPSRSLEVDCDSLDCPVFFQRIKYQDEADKIVQFAKLLRTWEEEDFA